MDATANDVPSPYDVRGYVQIQQSWGCPVLALHSLFHLFLFSNPLAQLIKDLISWSVAFGVSAVGKTKRPIYYWNITIHSTLLTVPGVLIFRFPTIYFSPAGQKQNPKRYEVCSLREYSINLPATIIVVGVVKANYAWFHLLSGGSWSQWLHFISEEGGI